MARTGVSSRTPQPVFPNLPSPRQPRALTAAPLPLQGRRNQGTERPPFPGGRQRTLRKGESREKAWGEQGTTGFHAQSERADPPGSPCRPPVQTAPRLCPGQPCRNDGPLWALPVSLPPTEAGQGQWVPGRASVCPQRSTAVTLSSQR